MRGYPQFSFWISMTLVKIYISCIIINRRKNTFDLVGTVLNQWYYCFVALASSFVILPNEGRMTTVVLHLPRIIFIWFLGSWLQKANQEIDIWE